MRLSFAGVTAHGSMPERGVNAIDAEILALIDRAVVGVDVRTISGQSNKAVRDQILAVLSDKAEVEPVVDLGPVCTDPDDPWVREVLAQAERGLGRKPKVETAACVTDATVLAPAHSHPPTVIMAPMAMAHQTDEYCEVDEIDRCAAAFAAIGRAYLT